eukprot:363221-Chlamydomonas_euryale.AAC.13
MPPLSSRLMRNVSSRCYPKPVRTCSSKHAHNKRKRIIELGPVGGCMGKNWGMRSSGWRQDGGRGHSEAGH